MEKFVLFAEDDLIQVRILRAVCKNLTFAPSDFTIVADGAEAIAFLKRSLGPNPAEKKPGLLITDWKMPNVDGLELLKWIRSTEQFCEMPVIILWRVFKFNNREEY